MQIVAKIVGVSCHALNKSLDLIVFITLHHVIFICKIVQFCIIKIRLDIFE